MTEKLTLNKFEEAAELVKKVTLPTKLEYSETLSNMTGGKIYLKPENLQYTGAYKVRGAFYKIATLNEEQRSHGLITASAGNHAQGVAYADFTKLCRKNNPLEVIFLISGRFSVKLYVRISSEKYERGVFYAYHI